MPRGVGWTHVEIIMSEEKKSLFDRAIDALTDRDEKEAAAKAAAEAEAVAAKGKKRRR